MFISQKKSQKMLYNYSIMICLEIISETDNNDNVQTTTKVKFFLLLSEDNNVHIQIFVMLIFI